MRIGIPVENGILCVHFGRCAEFALIDVDETRLVIRNIMTSQAPEHEPGVRPRWMIQNGVKVAIVNGIGTRARNTLEAAGVRVIAGVQPRPAIELVQAYLDGNLVSAPSSCESSSQRLLNRVRCRSFRHQHGHCHHR